MSQNAKKCFILKDFLFNIHVACHIAPARGVLYVIVLRVL